MNLKSLPAIRFLCLLILAISLNISARAAFVPQRKSEVCEDSLRWLDRFSTPPLPMEYAQAFEETFSDPHALYQKLRRYDFGEFESFYRKYLTYKRPERMKPSLLGDYLETYLTKRLEYQTKIEAWGDIARIYPGYVQALSEVVESPEQLRRANGWPGWFNLHPAEPRKEDSFFVLDSSVIHPEIRGKKLIPSLVDLIADFSHLKLSQSPYASFGQVRLATLPIINKEMTIERRKNERTEFAFEIPQIFHSIFSPADWARKDKLTRLFADADIGVKGGEAHGTVHADAEILAWMAMAAEVSPSRMYFVTADMNIIGRFHRALRDSNGKPVKVGNGMTWGKGGTFDSLEGAQTIYRVDISSPIRSTFYLFNPIFRYH